MKIVMMMMMMMMNMLCIEIYSLFIWNGSKENLRKFNKYILLNKSVLGIH